MTTHDGAAVNLQTATITGVSELLRSRKLSPVELIKATLDRIHALNPRLNAYTTVTSEYAVERARQAEDEITHGQYRGPLHGIPYSLKDLIDTEGIRTTYGYRSHQDYVPEESATVHLLLERAGAILVGKADCHFRRSVPVRCFNPWDLSRSPGRSSSGSGASLAASMALVSIGSDSGGSVRIPAAWTGVVGLKATFGLISRYNSLAPAWSVDQVGPMAKTVEDVAIVLQAIARHDPNDAVSLQTDVPDYRYALRAGSSGPPLRGVRVGILEQFLGEGCDEEIEAAVRQAVRTLGELGADASQIDIPGVTEAGEISRTISEAEAAVIYPEVFPKERLERIDDDVSAFLDQARKHTLAEYLQSQRRAAVVRQAITGAMRRVDILVAPTVMYPPILVSEEAAPTVTIRGRQYENRKSRGDRSFTKTTIITSMTGQPALSVPCGFTSQALPIGLQIFGRPLEESLLLRVAHWYEQATDWHRRHPNI